MILAPRSHTLTPSYLGSSLFAYRLLGPGFMGISVASTETPVSMEDDLESCFPARYRSAQVVYQRTVNVLI